MLSPSEMGGMFVHSEAPMQDPKNRQNSVDTEDERLQMIWASRQTKLCVKHKRHTNGQ